MSELSAKMKDFYDVQLKVGDMVKFGDKEKGTVVGETEDGRLRVEVKEVLFGHYGEKTWTYMFVIPPGTSKKMETSKEEKEFVSKESQVSQTL
jgi:hypothetical protein